MPATNFPEYARAIQDVLDATVTIGEAVLISVQIDPRSSLRGFIAGLLRFRDGSELHFREFVNTTLDEPRMMYAYHYQDSQDELIFRYDNAPHRPQLSRVEHKHTPEGPETSNPPTLAQVVDEILRRA